MVLFKDIFDEDKYTHFMLISIAARILLTENQTKKLLNYATKLLAIFYLKWYHNIWADICSSRMFT